MPHAMQRLSVRSLYIEFYHISKAWKASTTNLLRIQAGEMHALSCNKEIFVRQAWHAGKEVNILAAQASRLGLGHSTSYNSNINNGQEMGKL